MEQLTEEEKKALRGSKFAPLPRPPCSSSSSSSGSQPRLAHPGGPMKTNKAAALAKFLERKLQEPNGLSSLDPRLIEVAVKNAKETLQSSSGRTTTVQHVDSFGDSEEIDEDEEMKSKKNKKRKKKKKMKLKKEKQSKKFEESSSGMVKKPKKKLKRAS